MPLSFLEYLPGISIQENSVAPPAPFQEIPAIFIPSSKEVQTKFEQKFFKKGIRYLSATAITTYLTCPLRFYFQYLAELPEPQQLEEQMEGGTFGSVLHNTLEILYQPFEGKRVQPRDIHAMQAKLPKAIYAAFENAKIGWGERLTGMNYLFREVIESLCIKILEGDEKEAPFTVEHVEADRLFEQVLEVEGYPFVLNGTFDRVDYQPALEAMRILDYKTGRVAIPSKYQLADSFKRVNGEKKKDGWKEGFQGHLYAWLFHKKYPTSRVTVGFYVVRGLSGGVQYLYQGAPFSDDALETFEQSLGELLVEMYEGDYEQTSREEDCLYCPYKGICGR
ncbi:MAG: PD-(D/E)XK nuclease family protein [Bacteroidota bacterium]